MVRRKEGGLPNPASFEPRIHILWLWGQWHCHWPHLWKCSRKEAFGKSVRSGRIGRGGIRPSHGGCWIQIYRRRTVDTGWQANDNVTIDTRSGRLRLNKLQDAGTLISYQELLELKLAAVEVEMINIAEVGGECCQEMIDHLVGSYAGDYVGGSGRVLLAPNRGDPGGKWDSTNEF